jgi:hypothetical protein
VDSDLYQPAFNNNGNKALNSGFESSFDLNDEDTVSYYDGVFEKLARLDFKSARKIIKQKKYESMYPNSEFYDPFQKIDMTSVFTLLIDCE